MWIWQRAGWPAFRFDEARFERESARCLELERALHERAGASGDGPLAECRIEAMVSELAASFEIEGESIDREAVRSSLRHRLAPAPSGAPGRDAKADALAGLLLDAREGWREGLTHERLAVWQSAVLAGNRTPLHERGAYRLYASPMQVVSGTPHSLRGLKVHYEAPAAEDVPRLMDGFLDWHNAAPPLPGLVRAAVAHVRFELIHPFEDGNGRVGRAVADHALCQAAGRPVAFPLSSAIRRTRSEYYAALERVGRGDGDLDGFLEYFTGAAFLALGIAEADIDFTLNNIRLLGRVGERVNPRQRRVLLRMLREGSAGFAGGLSVRNYMTIARCWEEQAVADIGDLVEMDALCAIVGTKSPRYGIARQTEEGAAG